MIIFYKKKTGRIVGTIEGRIHGEESLKQWIGDKEETDRIIFTWKKNDDESFEPEVTDNEQKQILVELDKKPITIYDFNIDINSKKLIRK
jgi:hypothetical protein